MRQITLVAFVTFLACSSTTNSKPPRVMVANQPSPTTESTNFTRPPPPPPKVPVNIQQRLFAGGVIKLNELKVNVTLPKPMGQFWLMLKTADGSIFDDGIYLLDHPLDLPVVAIKGYGEFKSLWDFVSKRAFDLAESDHVCTAMVEVPDQPGWLTFSFESVDTKRRMGVAVTGRLFARQVNSGRSIILVLAMWPRGLEMNFDPELLELIKNIKPQ